MKNTNKFSSGYIPPEMARLLWQHIAGERVNLRSGVKDLNGNDYDLNLVRDGTFEACVKEIWSKHRDP